MTKFRELIHIKFITSIISPINTIFRVKNSIINFETVKLLRSLSRSLEVRTPIIDARILLNHIL